MKYAIKHLFHIRATREAVYNALTTIEGLSNWWTVDTSGNSNPGGVLKFRFDGQGPDMKVMDLKPGKSVTWECLDKIGWPGHILTFSLDENEGKTRVRFSHEGWDVQDDFFANCNFSWGRYLESLRQLCQTGKGAAYQSAVSSRQ
jgi:uncharacterized protein YndB with AHSA1/START domain